MMNFDRAQARMIGGFVVSFLEYKRDLHIDAQTPSEILEDLVPDMRDWATDRFRRDRHLHQTYVLVTLSGIALCSPMGATVDNKGWIADGMRELAQRYGAKALFTVAEVWISENPGISPEAFDRKVTAPGYVVREDPDRREAVVLLLEHPSARPPVQCWQALIERNKGRPKLLEWVDRSKHGQWAGALTYLLPPAEYGPMGSA